jgi:hypothetical protein
MCRCREANYNPNGGDPLSDLILTGALCNMCK